jgi:hypothetical protein
VFKKADQVESENKIVLLDDSRQGVSTYEQHKSLCGAQGCLLLGTTRLSAGPVRNGKNMKKKKIKMECLKKEMWERGGRVSSQKRYLE